jgi:hypothetical protein
MDAPDLAGNPAAWGKVRTRLVEGACRAVDEHGLPVLEQRRVADALVRAREQALTRAK